MKNKLLTILAAVILLFFPTANFAQAPNLGTTSSYALFTAEGAFTNVGASNVTGNIGTNVGAFTGFPPGTVVGQIHVADPASAQAAIDVAVAYSNLSALTCGQVIATTLGNGQILTPDVYCTGSASTLNGNLILDGQGNPNALFIIKINGALTTSTFTNVNLINSAIPSNVYWQINGEFSLGDGSVFRGTIIANGAITLLEASSLFGRGLSVAGAISLNNNLVNLALPQIASIITANGPTTFCSGQSVVLSGNIGGTWNTGATTPTITVTTSGDYFVTNTNAFGTVTSNHIIVTVNPSPAAVAGVNISICQNASAQIGAPAVAGSTYSWSSLPAGFTSTLANPIVSPTVTTTYTVVETTATGCQNTNSVTVTVNLPTSIITQPANQTICAGSSVSFSVIATGTGLTYQWRKGIVNLSNTGNISGATSATLTFNPANVTDAASNYNVVISSICSQNMTSVDVSLVVNTAPAIITQPVNQTACAGSTVSFSVSATGTGITYQWRKGTTNLSNGGNISGATSATLTINPASIADAATDYNVVITGICAPIATSANVSLVVNTAPAIITQPVPQTVCAGNTVSFSVSATGTGITYQWRKGTTNLSNVGNISGATSGTLTINPVNIADAAADYNVVITGTCTPVATSQNVYLVVNTAPNITTEPANQLACIGSSVSFSITATGTVLTYQWRRGTSNLTNGGNISGATSAILTINPVSISDLGSDYNVVVSGTCPPIAASVNAALGVYPPPIINCPENITQSTDPNVCNAIVNNITPTIIGNCPAFTITYQLTGMTTGSGTGNANGLTFNKGVTTVTYIVTDVTGLAASCQFTITINDTQAPFINPPADIVVFTNPGECFASDVVLVNASASDNCITLSITNNAPPFYLKGVNTITWSATDESGNISEAFQTITVIDNQPPTITCPPDITANVNPGICMATDIFLGNVITTDNCPGTIVSNNAPGTYSLGVNTVTWTVIDASGNSLICNQLITIIDNIPPTITCPPDITVTTDLDECFATNITLGTPVSSDNCFVINISNNAPSLFAYGDNFVTWIAIDASGNATSCMQMITVIDNQPPDIACPPDITVNGTTIVVIPPPVISDNCGIASVTNSFNGSGNASGSYPIGTTIVTWIVTDIHGNTATCTQSVLVNCPVIAQNDFIVMPINITGPLNLSGNDLICGSAIACDFITIIVPPTHLTAILSTIPGELIITPQFGFIGTDSLLYQICCLFPDGSSLCSTAWAFITFAYPPSTIISGNATICLEGSTTIMFTLTGQPPFTIQYTDGVNIYTVSGIMSNTYFIGVQPVVSTNYTLVSVLDASGLYGSVSGQATIIINAIPHFIVTGGGNYCSNTPGVIIGLSGSTPGIIYQVELYGSPFGTPITGTGQPINFGLFTIPGYYYVRAFDPITECTTMMYGIAPVYALPGPIVYDVTGGGECCFGCFDVFVGLSGSQIGVLYQVWLNNTTLFLNIPGTGGTLDFGMITQAGLYTVTATDGYGCTIIMNSYAVVTIHPRPVATLAPGNITICEGDSALLWFNTYVGTGPFSFVISTGDSTFTIDSIICTPVPFAVFPTHTTTYTLQYVYDAYCINYGTGTSTVNVVECVPNPVFSATGYVRYNNSLSTPMNNVIVSLDHSNTIVRTVTTDVNGYYHFDNLVPGVYKLLSTSSKPWGGSNSTDALIISNHYTQITHLTGINLKAADVNASNYVNSVDALFVARRYVQLIDAFPAGNWAFEKPVLNITNASVNADILALTYGDVNGSYIPSNVKQPSIVNLSASGTREIHSYEQFEVPLSTTNHLMPGAISLVINYPADLLEVTSIIVEDPEDGTLAYNTGNGELRIAWYNTKGLNLGSGETILRLGFKAKNLMNTHDADIYLSLGAGSEFASPDGIALPGVELNIPKLVIATPTFDITIYPNPTKGSTQFVYVLPEQGNVNMKLYDMLGKEVATLVSGWKDAGPNYLIFDAQTLPQGVYTCRLVISCSTQTRTIIRRLAIID